MERECDDENNGIWWRDRLRYREQGEIQTAGMHSSTEDTQDVRETEKQRWKETDKTQDTKNTALVRAGNETLKETEEQMERKDSSNTQGKQHLTL